MKILAIQNRIGIGDLILFLPYVYSISKKFNIPINLLVRESTKAKQLLKNSSYIDEIIILDRDDKNKIGELIYYGANVCLGYAKIQTIYILEIKIREF